WVLPHANRSSRARACDPGSPRAGRSGARVEIGLGEKRSPRGSPRRGPDGCPAESGAPPTGRAIAERKSPAAERAFILTPRHGSPPGSHSTASVTRARDGGAPFGGVCDDYSAKRNYSVYSLLNLIGLDDVVQTIPTIGNCTSTTGPASLSFSISAAGLRK